MSNDDITHVSGNVSPELKRAIIKLAFSTMASTSGRAQGFGDAIAARLLITEVSIEKKAEEPQKQEGRVVCELTVEEDMLNAGGNIHGGCSAFLIDFCSSMALAVFLIQNDPTAIRNSGVSQSLNIVYHSPAALGDKIRVVNTTITVGARAMSVRTEIWNVTHHRLVASGVHIKMHPSIPKPKL